MNAPGACPKSSASIGASGIAAQLTRDERPAPPARLVQRPRQELLAGAGGDTAEVRAGPVTLALTARGLAPGPARLSVRPDRLAIVGDESPNTLPGTVTKTMYAASHSEVAVDTALGPIFLVSTDTATLPAPGARVAIAFAPAGPVLLLA